MPATGPAGCPSPHPATPCRNTRQRPRAPCPATAGRTTPAAAPDATHPSGSWRQPARLPPGPGRTRPAHQSRTPPAHPAQPGHALHAGPARPPGSTWASLAFTDPARSALETIDPQKSRNDIRNPNKPDRAKNPQVQGLDGLKRPQGTLGIFIRNGPGAIPAPRPRPTQQPAARIPAACPGRNRRQAMPAAHRISSTADGAAATPSLATPQRVLSRQADGQPGDAPDRRRAAGPARLLVFPAAGLRCQAGSVAGVTGKTSAQRRGWSLMSTSTTTTRACRTGHWDRDRLPASASTRSWRKRPGSPARSAQRPDPRVLPGRIECQVVRHPQSLACWRRRRWRAGECRPRRCAGGCRWCRGSSRSCWPAATWRSTWRRVGCRPRRERCRSGQNVRIAVRPAAVRSSLDRPALACPGHDQAESQHDGVGGHGHL